MTRNERTDEQPIILDCGHPESPHSDITRGYGTDAAGRKHCYACCAEQDRAQMRDTGYWVGYFHDGMITNWPGSLKLPAIRVKHSRGYGFGGSYPIVTGNFIFEGYVWAFRNAGNSQITQCKRTARRVRVTA